MKMWVTACPILAVLQTATVLSVALSLQTALAQPFKVAAGVWEAALPEPSQRRASGGQGMIFDSKTATVSR